jgi:hypothetical protein
MFDYGQWVESADVLSVCNSASQHRYRGDSVVTCGKIAISLINPD